MNGAGAYPESDQGLYEIAKKSADQGKFRTPTLRNIAFSAPYMRDGSISTLEEVIEQQFMAIHRHCEMRKLNL